MRCVSCSKQLEGETEVSKMEALQWVAALVARDARLMVQQQAAPRQQLLLGTLCEALSAASGAYTLVALVVVVLVCVRTCLLHASFGSCTCP